ncbi:ion channel [Virgibacillus sp. C22-A2]|uniref:Ion channel n=1 Tax=Virgibacillus tibetensis TaxID=3042313 RepID=A0ABU6KKQ3_9BACI|nr:ion channel [Virgibacillus sp. C22-A2]
MFFRIINKAVKADAKAIIFIGLIVFVLISTRIIQLIEPETFNSYFNALWWVMTTITTVGYGDISPVTVGGQLFAIIVIYIFGIGIMGVAIGYIVDVYVEYKKKKEKGKLTYKGKNHFVVINYSKRSKETIEELINMHDKIEIVLIDETINITPLDDEKVHFISGDPADIRVLEKANISKSNSVMIFSSEGVSNASFADGQTLLIAMAIESYSEKIDTPIYTIAEVTSEKHITSFIHGGVDEFVTPNHTSARLIAKSGSYKGVSEVFRQLTSSNYGEDIFIIKPHRGWKTYQDAFNDLYKQGATLLSVDNNLDVSAKSNEKLNGKSKLLIVCKNDTFEEIKKYVS